MSEINNKDIKTTSIEHISHLVLLFLLLTLNKYLPTGNEYFAKNSKQIFHGRSYGLSIFMETNLYKEKNVYL